MAGKGNNPNSLANLRKPWQAGECGNPLNKNHHQITRSELVALYLDARSERNPDKSRIEMVLDKIYARALAGSDAAARLLVEQYAGRAQMRMHVTGTVNGNDAANRERTSAEVRDDIMGMLDEDERAYLGQRDQSVAEIDQAVAEDQAGKKN